MSEQHISSLPFNPNELVESVLSLDSQSAVSAESTELGTELILELLHARTESKNCLEAYDQLIQFATVRGMS